MCYSIKAMKKNVSTRIKQEQVDVVGGGQNKTLSFFFFGRLVFGYWLYVFAFLQEDIQKYKRKRASCQIQPTQRLKQPLQTLFLSPIALAKVFKTQINALKMAILVGVPHY